MYFSNKTRLAGALIGAAALTLGAPAQADWVAS
jgi:hypothetical protein